MTRTGAFRASVAVIALAGIVAVVLLLSPWWDRHRLNARLDSAPVPASWTTARTFQGSGDAPLGDDTRPWVVRQFQVHAPRPSVVVQAADFLKQWGCDQPFTDDRTTEVLLQTSCPGGDVALFVSSNQVFAASGHRSATTRAPVRGSAVSIWLGHQGP